MCYCLGGLFVILRSIGFMCLGGCFAWVWGFGWVLFGLNCLLWVVVLLVTGYMFGDVVVFGG